MHDLLDETNSNYIDSIHMLLPYIPIVMLLKMLLLSSNHVPSIHMLPPLVHSIPLAMLLSIVYLYTIPISDSILSTNILPLLPSLLHVSMLILVSVLPWLLPTMYVVPIVHFSHLLLSILVLIL
jgi:hypothetical protein